jgi:hypothetical protein
MGKVDAYLATLPEEKRNRVEKFLTGRPGDEQRRWIVNPVVESLLQGFTTRILTATPAPNTIQKIIPVEVTPDPVDDDDSDDDVPFIDIFAE